MYLKDTSESLTRIGPRTPMGEVLRRFWVPALLEHELSKLGGDPIELRLFGEDLVAEYVEGGLAITDRYFKEMAPYPSIASGGIVWAYLGPQNFTPQLLAFPWLSVPPIRRSLSRHIIEYNWAYAIETSLAADTRPAFLPPFYTSAAPDRGHAHVPIDDQHTCLWSFGAEAHVDRQAPTVPAATEVIADFHHRMVVMARDNARGHIPDAASHGEWYAGEPFPD